MKTLILTLLLIMMTAAGFGQTYSVLLKNAEEATFYYVLDPPELSGFDPTGSVFLTVLYEYFAASTAEPGFKSIPAGAVQRLEGLSPGTHLLVGFFPEPEQREYPVRVLRLRAGGGIDERFYTIYKEPTLVLVKAGAGRLKDFSPGPAPVVTAEAQEEVGKEAPGPVGIRIDNQYEEWEDIPFLAVFSEEYSPHSFSREQYGDSFEVFPISESRHWGEGGTPLNKIKTVTAADRVYLFCSAHSTISENLSVFLYFHSDRKLGVENKVTMELAPAEAHKPGLVVLWVKGQKPSAVGRLVSGNFFLEAEIDLVKLSQALEAQGILKPITLDLTSSYYDNIEIAYEEFFFTTLAISDIPSYAEATGAFRY